jgi:hypothetical protein
MEHHRRYKAKRQTHTYYLASSNTELFHLTEHIQILNI